MSDSIVIRNLEVWTHIGVPEEERAQKQKLKISVSFKACHVARAAAMDDLALSTNYFAVSERVKEIAAERPRKLIETLAEELARRILLEFGLPKVRIEIRKFILPDAEWVGIEIERKAAKHKGSKHS